MTAWSDTEGIEDEGFPAPILLRLSGITPTPLQWLWPGRFPLGKLSILVGDPSLGKSLITTDMAARVSTGTPWPDTRENPNQVGSVLLLSAEDDPEDTIVPRLKVAGAELSRVHLLSTVRQPDGKLSPFTLAEIDALHVALTQLDDVRLVVIDPVSAYLGGTDSHKNGDVRGLLAPLSALAQKHRVAVVAVTHLTKSYGGKAMYRATGSLAFVAAARAAWLVTADPDEPDGKRRLMLSVKSNLGPGATGIAYRVSTKDLGELGPQPVIVWDSSPVTKTADEVLATEMGTKGEGNAKSRATEWLTDFLASGPAKYGDVMREAIEAGYNKSTIRRAKDDLGIKPKRIGFGSGGVWMWALPIDEQKAIDAHHDSLSTYGESEHLCPQGPVARVGGDDDPWDGYDGSWDEE